jgi:hypothetical protein
VIQARGLESSAAPRHTRLVDTANRRIGLLPISPGMKSDATRTLRTWECTRWAAAWLPCSLTVVQHAYDKDLQPLFETALVNAPEDPRTVSPFRYS